MFVYDFPLSSKARTYLKFELIFQRIEASKGVNTEAETMSLMRGLVDYLDLLDGYGALKVDLVKDLERLTQKIKLWQGFRDADQVLLTELLDQITSAHQVLNSFTRQRAVLQTDPIFGTIKPRFLTPGGVNCFDTPLYTYWTQLPVEEKRATVDVWIHELDSLRIPITCILDIWRLCADYQVRLAPQGFMQESSEPCEFVEIRYPKEVRGYPVVSGFQNNINVRFYPYAKGAPVGDITFELAFVRGGII